MEKQIGLPRNYVELEQEEMMYLDGGWYTNIAIGRGVVTATLKGALYAGGIAACSKAIVAAKLVTILKFPGKVLSATIIGGIASVIKYSIDWMCDQVGLLLDPNRNGWIGIYVHDKYGYIYTQ